MPRSTKTALLLAHITHPNDMHSYEIISIKGLPFYQSSGEHSQFANTWFPFFGVLENKDHAFFPLGWFIKAFSTKLPANIIHEIKIRFPSFDSHTDAGRQLLTRLWNVPCLLLSSSLGGGLWDEERGKALKAVLMKEFPEYYQQIPPLAIEPSSQLIPDYHEVNQWLCHKALLDHPKELQATFPQTIADLLKKLEVKAPVKPELHTGMLLRSKRRLPALATTVSETSRPHKKLTKLR